MFTCHPNVMPQPAGSRMQRDEFCRPASGLIAAERSDPIAAPDLKAVSRTMQEQRQDRGLVSERGLSGPPVQTPAMIRVARTSRATTLGPVFRKSSRTCVTAAGLVRANYSRMCRDR